MDNKNLEIINEQEVLGKEFRIYGTFEEPLFLAKDVAEWIDYAWKDAKCDHRDVSKMLKTVDEDEKLRGTVFLSGQNREAWLLTEDGLNEVLMQSRKPIAKQYKKKVKAILKEVRKTGAYVSPNAAPLNEASQVQVLIQQNAKMMEVVASIVKNIEETNERIVSCMERIGVRSRSL